MDALCTDIYYTALLPLVLFSFLTLKTKRQVSPVRSRSQPPIFIKLLSITTVSLCCLHPAAFSGGSDGISYTSSPDFCASVEIYVSLSAFVFTMPPFILSASLCIPSSLNNQKQTNKNPLCLPFLCIFLFTCLNVHVLQTVFLCSTKIHMDFLKIVSDRHYSFSKLPPCILSRWQSLLCHHSSLYIS